MILVRLERSSPVLVVCWIFFFKQKTAYEMRISDWSSDVCSSDLMPAFEFEEALAPGIDIGIQVVVLLPPGVSWIQALEVRSAESRVGKECVRTCRSRWSPLL